MGGERSEVIAVGDASTQPQDATPGRLSQNDTRTAGTVRDEELSACPDCGGSLHLVIPGFRPLTAAERRRLTPHAVRVLGLCSNPGCL
jgi:hypothetical protein